MPSIESRHKEKIYSPNASIRHLCSSYRGLGAKTICVTTDIHRLAIYNLYPMAEWRILLCISNPFNDNNTRVLLYQVTEPWPIWIKFKIRNYLANFNGWCLRYLLWDCPQWMSLDLTGEKAMLVHVKNHYLSQCWPTCHHIAATMS